MLDDGDGLGHQACFGLPADRALLADDLALTAAEAELLDVALAVLRAPVVPDADIGSTDRVVEALDRVCDSAWNKGSDSISVQVVRSFIQRRAVLHGGGRV